MKKLIAYLLLVLIIKDGMAQTETFDIASYTAPRNFNKENKPGGVVYSMANDSSGKFCAIIIFTSMAGTGDVTKDFKQQWDELAVKKHSADPNPTTEKGETNNGWKALTGASLFKVKGTDAYIILTVFSGHGRRLSIISTLNDPSYLSQLDAFLGTIVLSGPVVSKQDKEIETGIDKANNGLIGIWSDYSGTIANYVTPSGAFIGSADSHEMNQYEFKGDNNFSYQYLGSMGATLLYIKSSGTYKADKDKLQFITTKYESCMGSKGVTGKLKEDKSKEITESYQFFIGPNKWEAGPFLNLHRDGKYYPWSDFPYEYFKKRNEVTNQGEISSNGSAANTAVNIKYSNNKFGSLLYVTPANWNLTKYSDGDILMPADIPKSEFLEIWVMPASRFPGTAEQALQNIYDETVISLKAKKMRETNGTDFLVTPLKKSFHGWEYIRCSGAIQMGGTAYPPEYGLDLFVIHLNDRFETVAVVKLRSNCGLSRYYPSEKRAYYNDIENFLFFLRFPDWKEPVLQPGYINGDGITAVWQGISLSVGTAKASAITGAELKGKNAIFFSNGQVFFGSNFPNEGLEGMNTWIKAEQNRRDWGTYTFSNGKGLIKLPYADIPLRMENNQLILTTNKTEHGFIKMSTVDGAVFNGSYVFSSKNLFGTETGKTAAIHFTSNGKFTDNGAVSIMYHEYNDCLNAAKLSGSGSYEIKNHSIVFKYTDGRKIKIAFMGSGYEKSNQNPATLILSLNEDVFNRY